VTQNFVLLFMVFMLASTVCFIAVHIGNDFTDNLKSFGYHFGIWKTKTVQKKRSRSHLVNYFKYIAAFDLLKKDPQPTIPPENDEKSYTSDLLFAYRMTTPMTFPNRVKINELVIDLSDISKKDLEYNEKFTRIQTDLYRESLHLIHKFLKDQKVPIFHTFVYNTPDWYINDVTALIREVPTYGNRIIYMGGFPERDSFGKPYANEHSGGHFSPEFNFYWAEQMIEDLKRQGVI